MLHIHENGAIRGAAFPSSHVAATVIPWWYIWKWLPKHRWWFTTVLVLLSASTVYCRYHYVVDVIGGLVLAWAVLALGSRLDRRAALRVPD
jgi:membrane-associated phospholipid phosphatase